MSVEQKVNEQWNKAIENTIVKAGYSAVASAFGAFILFRGPFARISLVALGVGMGIGYSLSENKLAFERAGKNVHKEAAKIDAKIDAKLDAKSD